MCRAKFVVAFEKVVLKHTIRVYQHRMIDGFSGEAIVIEHVKKF